MYRVQFHIDISFIIIQDIQLRPCMMQIFLSLWGLDVIDPLFVLYKIGHVSSSFDWSVTNERNRQRARLKKTETFASQRGKVYYHLSHVYMELCTIYDNLSSRQTDGKICKILMLNCVQNDERAALFIRMWQFRREYCTRFQLAYTNFICSVSK